MFKKYPDVRFNVDKSSGRAASFLLFTQLLDTMEVQLSSKLTDEKRQ
jgi:hypothetical protein